MQLIYVYGGCSPTKYQEYVESRGQALHPQTLETMKWLETTL